jgi:gliding motility-associated-like protein
MKKLLFLLTCICFIALSVRGQQNNGPLPLLFVENQGQWQQPFLYKGISANADIYLENGGITYVVGDATNPEKIEAVKEKGAKDALLKYHSYKMKWLGANLKPMTQGGKKQAFYHNYYLGKDPGHWKSKVPVFGNIDYKDVYPNVDMHISSAKGNAKYEFIVNAGADASLIHLAFEGLDGMSVVEGSLFLKTSVGTIQEMAPYAYQYVNGDLKEVRCEYKLSGNELTYSFPKGYNKTANLIIDPTIVFATLTGSTADNWGFTATYDQAGNFYAGGIVGGLGYPTTTGAFQVTFHGGTTPSTELPCDISITKFNTAGSLPIYSTYIGGSQDEMPHSLVVDANNNLVLVGKSLSTDYPVSAGAYDNTANGGYDIVVTKFNADGTALLGSTYMGGANDDGTNITSGYYGNHGTLRYNYGDASRSEVLCDKLGNIYVAASSQSSNFPVTSTAAKGSLGGTQDGVFFKFNPTLTSLTYSTYIGGSGNDAAYVLAFDTAQAHIYVSGGTQSTDFHTSVMTGAYKNTYQGGLADGYILKFLNSGTYTLQKGTYIGTADYDQCYGVQIDLENSVYVMGQTMGAFPVSSGVYSNAGSHQFLLKIDSTLSSAVYSTVLGSGATATPNFSPVAFLVDTCQNVYISGWGSDIPLDNGGTSGMSTSGLPITSNALQSTTDGNDFYFIVLSKNAIGLLYGTYFGSAGKEEHVDGGTSRFNPDGVVYQAICASCGTGSAFPSTPGAYASTKGSNNCNLGALKIAFNLGGVHAIANANPNTSGCAPLNVNFGNTSSNATAYYWDFNDGGATSTAVTPSHTFNTPGNYSVMMVAINPNACKTHDTVYLSIVVLSDTIHADFTYQLLDTCGNPHINITNTSLPRPGYTLANASFQWFFGDGGTSNVQNPPSHNYASPGTYDIMMIMTEPGACNSPDTVVKPLSFNRSFVTAGFNLPDSVCLGDSIPFLSTSVNGIQFKWTFANGDSISNQQNASFTFDTPGTYTIKLVVTSPGSCNGIDSAQHTITVSSKPTAAFTFSPAIPQTNVPISFFNGSQNATAYHWDFGDQTVSAEMNPIHNYNRSGAFNVCLTAYNQQGCPDKVCKSVSADILPLADIPTGFSPNGDGSNDVLYVRGYSIKTMDLKIYNRWGQLVFESTEQSHGWDGTYKGKMQEMEVYAFVLQVTFFDGSNYHKQGNVTLLK